MTNNTFRQIFEALKNQQDDSQMIVMHINKEAIQIGYYGHRDELLIGLIEASRSDRKFKDLILSVAERIQDEPFDNYDSLLYKISQN